MKQRKKKNQTRIEKDELIIDAVLYKKGRVQPLYEIGILHKKMKTKSSFRFFTENRQGKTQN